MQEVRDTCELAVAKIEYDLKQQQQEALPANPYHSVDPAPPLPLTDVSQLKETLLDEKKSLFERYRAMFSLRNLGSEEAITALGEGKQW